MEQNPNSTRGEQQQRREQRFHFGPWTFNIARAEHLLAERPRDVRPLAVDDWARVYGLDTVGQIGADPLIGLADGFDTAYAMTTDLERPVLLATVYSKELQRHMPLLIDGTHRLYRAYQEHVPLLPAFLLDTQETLSIRDDLHHP